MNLFTEPVFHLLDRDGRHHIGSLVDILQNDECARFDYPIALMNSVAVHLAVGLIESALHYNDVSLSREQWTGMVSGEPWTQTLINAVANPPEGTDLFGDTAFMQMPAQIFDTSDESKERKPIVDLLQPYVLSGETTKGLRRIAEPVNRLCPSCTLIGLYTNHYFTAAISQYWSTAQSNGGLLLTVDAPSLPLHAVLAQNLLHRKYREAAQEQGYLEEKPWLRFPWVPDKNGKQGLNGDGGIPLETWLNPLHQRSSIEDFYLPMMRGIRLDEGEALPGECCDLCGSSLGQIKVTSFFIKGEQGMLKSLTEHAREVYTNSIREERQQKGGNTKKKIVLDFKCMYRQDLRHPSLTYLKDQKSDEWNRSAAPKFASNMHSRRPVWAGFLTVSTQGQPLLLQQWEGAREPDDRINRLIKRDLVPRLAGVGYKTGRGRDVDAVTLASYGYAQLAGIFRELVEKESVSKKLIEVAEQVVQSLSNAAKVMEKSVEYNDQGDGYRMKKKPKKGETGTISTTPEWLNMVDRIWKETLEELLKLVKLSRSDRKDEKEKSIKRIKQSGRKLLEEWLNRQGGARIELMLRYQEVESLKKYWAGIKA